MKAIILDGSIDSSNASDVIYRILADELALRGWSTHRYVLRDLKIAYCAGCFNCWVKTPGECVVDDAGREVAREAVQSDLAVLITPVTFGGYSSELKKMLDRVIPLGSPFLKHERGETHHFKRYPTYPKLVGIGILPKPDERSAEIFAKLVERNAINTSAPAYASEVIVPDRPDVMIETIKSLLERVGVV